MPEIVADNISVIDSAALEGASRLEAEYYQPRYLIFMDELSKYSVTKKTLLHLCEKIDVGFVGPMAHAYTTNGIPILQTQNVKEFVIDFTVLTYIQEWFHHVLQKSQVFSGDILIARSGSIGSAALVGEKTIKELNSSDIIIIRPKPSINKYYLCAYLNTKFGQAQIERFSSGGLQGHINISSLETLLVPLPDNKVQSLIGETVSHGMNLVTKATNLYAQAKSRLLSELGIKDIDLSHDPCYEVNSASTVSDNRIDAEYYQPKYETIIDAIKKCRYGWCNLADKVSNITDKYDPSKEPEKVFKYIELSNINPSIGVVDGYSELKGKDLPSRARMLVKEGDVIISSVEGSIDKVALIDNFYDGCLASTGFFVFRNKSNMISEYVLTLCKSVLIQKQLEKFSSGTILAAVPKNLVQNLIIPDIPKEAQKKVANLVQQSHAARRQARKLLEEAKRKVEEMIEKGSG